MIRAGNVRDMSRAVTLAVVLATLVLTSAACNLGASRGTMPPADANGFITNTDCANGWVCNDRQEGIANMVGWHNYAGGAQVANWYDDAVDLIAFSRGSRAWIAINNEDSAQTHTFTTGLRRGTYCDIIHGDFANGSCTGPTVTVDSHGQATVTVPANDSVAFDASNLVRR